MTAGQRWKVQDKMIAMLKEGMRPHEVGDKLHMSENTIRKWIKAVKEREPGARRLTHRLWQ